MGSKIDCRCNPYNHGFYKEQTPPDAIFIPGCNTSRPVAKTENKRRKELSPIYHMLDEDAKMRVRMHVENTAEIRKTADIASFKVETQMERYKMDVQDRAEKLKRILENEAYTYSQEIISKFENRKENRLEEMRQKVAVLKKQREEQEKAIVDKKMDKVFQTQCEQMRTLLTKRVTKEIVKDWDEQIRMKQRMQCEENECERMYAYLSAQDAANKWKREEAYNCARAAAAQKALRELDKQIEYKRAKQAQMNKIAQRELAINEQINKDIEEEKQKREAEKKARFEKAKSHVQEMMETRDYYRDRKVKREEIVAQEFLKKAVRELYVEEEDRNKKKKELMRAIEVYRDYIRLRDCYANQREVELQKIIDAVIDEQYEKVSLTRRKEKEQRKRLYCNVLAGRALQVQELQAEREKEEIERKKEVEELKADWRRYLQELDHEKAQKAKKQAEYRADLDSQMQYLNVVQEREAKEVEREREMGKLEDGFFQSRLQKTLAQAKVAESNPYREPLVGKQIKQCLRPV